MRHPLASRFVHPAGAPTDEAAGAPTDEAGGAPTDEDSSLKTARVLQHWSRSPFHQEVTDMRFQDNITLFFAALLAAVSVGLAADHGQAQTVTVYSPAYSPPVTVYSPPTVFPTVPTHVVGTAPVVVQRPAVSVAPMIPVQSPVMVARPVMPVAPAVAPAIPVATRPVVVSQKIYVPGQPVRNFFRAITP